MGLGRVPPLGQIWLAGEEATKVVAASAVPVALKVPVRLGTLVTVAVTVFAPTVVPPVSNS